MKKLAIISLISAAVSLAVFVPAVIRDYRDHQRFVAEINEWSEKAERNRQKLIDDICTNAPPGHEPVGVCAR